MWIKRPIFGRNNGCLMENMDKELTVPKCAENTPNAPNIICPIQFVCPSPKLWNFDEKRLHWVSVVRELLHCEQKKLNMKTLLML